MFYTFSLNKVCYSKLHYNKKNVEQLSSRQKDVELARYISILVAYKPNDREKCSSIKMQKGVQHETALYALFFAEKY